MVIFLLSDYCLLLPKWNILSDLFSNLDSVKFNINKYEVSMSCGNMQNLGEAH